MNTNHFKTQRQIAKIRIDTIKGTAKGYFKAKEFSQSRVLTHRKQGQNPEGLVTSFPSGFPSPPSSKDTREASGSGSRPSITTQPRVITTQRAASDYIGGSKAASTSTLHELCESLGVFYFGHD